ncbi:MAG: metallophosphoesterase [Ruminococcaceae bacterium]|nr:metallophosphoesterase [Oscillospiraceae bacterium]
MKLWIKLGIAAVAAGAAAVAASRENGELTIGQYTVECEGLPAEFDGLRLVQLSDLHAATFGKHQKLLVDSVEAIAPELVLITGDLIDRRRTKTVKGMEPALTLLTQLAERFPTVFVEGNHETMSPVGKHFCALAQRTGAHNITGRGMPVCKGNSRIVLLGIPDVSAFAYEEAPWRETMHTVHAPYADDFCIALSHRPHYFAEYEEEGLELVLSGHAHGGQVRLPPVGGLFAPEQGVFPKYTAGVHGEGDTKMVISRGLGNSGFPIRVGNRPEIVVITLKSK